MEDILDIKPKLVTPADSKVIGNDKVLDTIKLDTKINIPNKDNIKLTKFSNIRVDNAAIKDSKTVNIAEVNPKLNIFINNFNNTVLNKNRDITVDKVINIIKIELSSIDIGITIF